jgi:hypothetical protein
VLNVKMVVHHVTGRLVKVKGRYENILRSNTVVNGGASFMKTFPFKYYAYCQAVCTERCKITFCIYSVELCHQLSAGSCNK